jgi:DNA polymerase I-like protein with 3'-5' exonuclease and polymerase domains
MKRCTKELRISAKSVNLAIIYGQGALVLGDILVIVRRYAKEIIDNYKKTIHGYKKYMADSIIFSPRNGLCTNIVGPQTIG